MDVMIGKTIGRYRIVEHLGRGGMAEVYKAHQASLDRYVAIKLMHTFLADEKEFLARFEREAKVVATLRHPNIVQVYDFDVDQGVYYMVMEFINGETLKARLQALEARGEWVSLDDAVRIVLAVGSALRYAHERNMVHRDVKPANVMITLDGQVILTDFGIAKIVSTSNLTASGAMVGTPSYMAPEQGMGQPGDERSDIYSLGVMLYQLVLGRLAVRCRYAARGGAETHQRTAALAAPAQARSAGCPQRGDLEIAGERSHRAVSESGGDVGRSPPRDGSASR